MGVGAKLKTRDAVALAARLHAYGPVVSEALQLAAYAHDGVFRREYRAGVEYRDPYIAHPIRNALRAARFLEDHYPVSALTEVLVACLLHDTVEDAPARVNLFYGVKCAGQDAALDTIRTHFGQAVCDTVHRVTNPPTPAGATREQRSARYLEHVRAAIIPSEQAFLTKAVDLVDNAGSLKHMDACDKRRNLARKYRAPVALMTDHAGVIARPEVREAVRERLEQVHREVSELSA